MSLDEIALRHGTDKSSAAHGYCPYYERHIGTPSTLLEIGIQWGYSLHTWQEFFPDARIMGVDISPNSQIPGCECHIGDATDPLTFKGWLPETVDVIIDDGSHYPPHVLATFLLLWPVVTPGGWYVIEDLACAFDGAFGGEESGGASFSLVTDLLKDTLIGPIEEFHAYEEIVFLRKAP